mgnify:CR=1 FL=1|tara:strand:+ start:1372 stop:2043 length:672 start_codon:yes stop_codon:yes gene_type:complete
MDIESLKEALGDEKFTVLKTYVDDLQGQRDSARQESITGRRGMKDKLAKLEADQTALMERLGIDSLEDLDLLPDAKGAAEAAKQYDVKLKRLERQMQEAVAQRDEISGKFRGSLQRAAIAEALSGHDFVARDLVETFVSQRLTWDGEDLLYKSDDGRMMPLKDGVAGIAKARPELLKSTGTGGAGVRASNAGGGGPKTLTRAEFEALAPAQRVEAAKSGVQLV